MNSINFPYKFYASLLAGALYGLWAFYSNYFAGSWPASIAGITQGCMSFIFTGLLSIAMEFTFAQIKHKHARTILTALLPLTVVISIMAFIHLAIGTPKVIKTITPSTVIGLFYCGFYALYLSQQRVRSS